MKEENIRLHLHHALQQRGWSAYHPQDARVVFCKQGHPALATPRTPGKSDTTATHYVANVPQAFIEVKDCKGQAFSFSEISEDQRKYLAKQESAWLCIGRIVPAGTKTKIHSIFVIPWLEWGRAEEDIRNLLDDKSMPYDYSLYTNSLERRGPDLVTRFKHYRLVYWEGDKK